MAKQKLHRNRWVSGRQFIGTITLDGERIDVTVETVKGEMFVALCKQPDKVRIPASERRKPKTKGRVPIFTAATMPL